MAIAGEQEQLREGRDIGLIGVRRNCSAEVAVVVISAADHRVAEAERRDGVLKRREQRPAPQRLVELVAADEDLAYDTGSVTVGR
ncbi:MAG: hypothetical protein QOK16_3973 [Solirubrobacteraceae bacterium]|nr:hypothetical protein [Solirubrobacteraceae bacterium]